MTFNIDKLEDWETVVSKILPQLRYSVLTLKGNLGAGKTTFTQYLLKSLGSKDEVNSPTYSIVNEYDTPKGKIFHFDLYRLKNLEEYLESAYLSIIEWPEIYAEDLADFPHHEMCIETNGLNREIIFK